MKLEKQNIEGENVDYPWICEFSNIQGMGGIHWDSVPMQEVQIEDLDKESFDIFRRQALWSGRMAEEDLNIPREELLRRLGLLSGTFLTRAGVLCFHREASCYVPGCSVKIGLFEGCEILYQDEVRGSLLLMADRAVELVYLKYLKARISYRKDTRIETYPYLREALREAVYNALIHSNWSLGVPIQIRIEPRSIWVSNACTLPFGWDSETLTQEHNSMPFNPSIASVFYRAGYIESWGRGIQKIFNACDAQGYPRPKYEVLGSALRMHFFAREDALLPSEEDASSLGQETKRTTPIPEITTSKNGLTTPIDKNTTPIQGVTTPIIGVTTPIAKVAREESKTAEILALVRSNPAIKIREIARIVNLSFDEAKWNLHKLKSEGLLERVGSNRAGRWVVLDPPPSTTEPK